MVLHWKETTGKSLAIKCMTLISMQPARREEMEYIYGAMHPMTMTFLAIWSTTLSLLPPTAVFKVMAFIIPRQAVISAITSSIMSGQAGAFTAGISVRE